MGTKKELAEQDREALITSLKARFENNMHRHEGMDWAKVQARLESNVGKLWSLHQMEASGGEPDVVSFDQQNGAYIFYDCAAESPKGRRSLCFDGQALESRKEHKPKNSAMDLAQEMGIALLSEAQYRELQSLQPAGKKLDTKTRVGYKHRLIYVNLAEPFLQIFATAISLCITMAPNRTTPPGASVAQSAFESGKSARCLPPRKRSATPLKRQACLLSIATWHSLSICCNPFVAEFPPGSLWKGGSGQ